jgi:predicted RNase H-like HicB family nuclease
LGKEGNMSDAQEVRDIGTDRGDRHLQYSLLIEWSSTDTMYVVTLPEWETWVVESDDLLPADIIPTITGRSYVEAAEEAKHAIEVLLGFCIADGHTPPEPRSTLKSPRLREQFRQKNQEESREQLASLYGYDPRSGLSLDAWIFSMTMAQALIQDRHIEDEAARQALYEEVLQATRQTVKRLLDS